MIIHIQFNSGYSYLDALTTQTRPVRPPERTIFYSKRPRYILLIQHWLFA